MDCGFMFLRNSLSMSFPWATELSVVPLEVLMFLRFQVVRKVVVGRREQSLCKSVSFQWGLGSGAIRKSVSNFFLLCWRRLRCLGCCVITAYMMVSPMCSEATVNIFNFGGIKKMQVSSWGLAPIAYEFDGRREY